MDATHQKQQSILALAAVARMRDDGSKCGGDSSVRTSDCRAGGGLPVPASIFEQAWENGLAIGGRLAEQEKNGTFVSW